MLRISSSWTIGPGGDVAQVGVEQPATARYQPPPPVPKVTRLCPHCGDPFLSSHGNKRYCSSSCSSRAQGRRQRAARRESAA